MARASKAEQEQRIEQFAELILRGAQRRDLIAWAKPRWGIQDRQLDKVIKAARERIGQSAHVDRSFEIGQAVHRLTLFMAQALKEGKLALALKAQHEINRLLGLGPRDGATEALDIATMRKNLKEIIAELFESGGPDGIC
jgi:hypothetical protein